MSNQITTHHQGRRGVNRLTHLCRSRWKKHRTKYGYDSLGQVTNACKYFANGTPVAGQQFGYTFDTIGNRTQTLSGGDATGANLRLVNYTPNNLNQIVSRDVAPDVDVMGASTLTNTVTVNGTNAYRNQEYFRAQVGVNNTNSALWTNMMVSGGQSVAGNVYVAQEPESFKYDTDGNLTNDGRWAYTWDGENRLTKMTVNTNVGPQYVLTFAYDAQGRRIQKISATNGVTIATYNFLYDGWNLVAELNQSDTMVRSYVWGTDLSGTPQGAGGVGGLLEVSYHGSSITNCFPAFDGNGNVAGLINAADGTIAANYEYAPFGEVVRSTGPLARNNPFRFSTKYQDDESDLLYYGYRYYNASTGRWLNRDPKDEIGFKLLKDGRINLSKTGSNQNYCPSCKRNSEKNPIVMIGDANIYTFVHNDPIEQIDYLGLDWEGQIDAAWFAAQKALPGSEFSDALEVFGACNSLGLALAWARDQYNDCVSDALMGPPNQDSAAERACDKKWSAKIKLLQNTYDAECKSCKPPESGGKHWWWPF